MEKKLAIMGHSTRGKEVIELLKMMSGNNKWLYNGSVGFVYFIEKNDKYITFCSKESIKNTGEYIIYELEEFLEKYPFKVGDKVIDTADGCPGIVTEMKWDESVSDMKYFVAFGNGIDFGWYVNDSIEFYKKNENLEETQSKRDVDKSEFIIKHMILPNKVDAKLEYEIIDGYEFDKVENGKIILKPIKSKYPKTYEECCEHLFNDKSYSEFKFIPAKICKTYYRGDFITHLPFESIIYEVLINDFYNLLVCRDAYWKIAGEELGLGKPWGPDWNEETDKFTISNKCNKIYLNNTAWYAEVLSFPTAEMRDAFYENFKDLIEQCKELL